MKYSDSGSIPNFHTSPYSPFVQQIHYAGNSDGSVGWAQDGAGFVSDTYTTNGPNDHTWHFDLTFAQMGWDPGDTWFQVFWGGNSDLDKPLQFYINNICVYVVPTLVIKKDANNIVLSWTNALYILQSAPEANGVYTNVPGATSPYTNPIAGLQQYFRLKR